VIENLLNTSTTGNGLQVDVNVKIDVKTAAIVAVCLFVAIVAALFIYKKLF